LSENVSSQSNEREGNRVLAFRRDSDGMLTQRGTFSTGGAGTGTPHLQSQGSVALTGGGRHLLVTNAASGDPKYLSETETTDARWSDMHRARRRRVMGRAWPHRAP
jgi:hypothetical protein